MVITFNELRRIVVAALHNYAELFVLFFCRAYRKRRALIAYIPVGIHLEKGPDGGVVTLDDASILECAMRIIAEQKDQQ